MAIAKKIKTKDGHYLKVPEEVWKGLGDSIEMFMLKEGYYMITPALGRPAESEKQPEAGNEGEKEQFELLHGISLIPFNRRDVGSIRANLDQRQAGMLDRMIEDRTVSIFEKEGKRFIQFSPNLYSKLKEYTSSAKAARPQRPSESGRSRGKVGDFAVFSKDEFREFQRGMDQKELKYLLVLPWFDGKVYVGSRIWLVSWGQKAMDAIRKRGELTNDELATDLRISADGARTVAISLCNEGIVIESKKGYYSLVE